MNLFNNQEYEALIRDVIGDAFYVDTSLRGKISEIRKYAEVVIRKM